MFLPLLLTSASLVAAKSRGRIVLKTVQTDETWGAADRISPTLKPESGQQFFKKDLPGDKRPAVDVLHFNHPYPVVQDSDEFDKDFVKDENADNGQWMAQHEYDRLRHKLTRLRKDVTEASAEKNRDKKKLDDAMKEYQQDMAESRAEIASKSKKVDELGKQMKAAKKSGVVSEDSKKTLGQQVPQKPKISPPPTQAPFHFDDPVPKAMRDLEECKRQLEEANAELKKLMEELEKAKVQQVEAQEKLNQAKIKETAAVKSEDEFHGKYKEEVSEHAAAEAAYLKQKAVVEKLKAELETASAKVKAMRAAEDKSGGVYPTPTKSGANSFSFYQLLSLFVVLVFFQGVP